MAITKDKLLPPSKSTVSMNFLPKTKKINTSKLLSPVEDKNEDNDNNILNSIGKKVLRIRDIFASTTLFKKKQTEKNRIQKEEETSDKNEKELENKQKDKDNKFKVPSIPGLGFLGFLKNFIFKTLIGYFVYNLIPHLPKLIDFIKLATPVFNFLLDWGGKALDGLLTFIDWGYKAIDKTEKFIKDMGGDNALKMFKKFEGAFTAFINGALIFGMLASGKGKGPGGGRGGGPGRGGRDGLYETRKARRGVSRVTTERGMNFRNDRTTGGTYKSGLRLASARIEKLAKAGKLTFDGKSTTDIGFQQRKGETDVMKKYVDKFGRDAAVRRFGQESVEGLGGKYARSGVTNLARKGFSMAPQRAALKFLGTGPAKFLTKGLAKIPVIGGLIDFAINLAMGEPIGRAAAKAVGSTAGAALGTLIPVPFAGTILGGYLGDIAGGMLYDSLTGGEKQKAAGGGRITRGGKSTSGPIKRTIKKAKRTVKIQPTKVKPGASVGGEEKIKKIFPEVKTGDKGKKVDTLGYMKSSYDKSSSIPGFGGLFGIHSKAQLGQKPSGLDYQNAAAGLNAWMQRTFSSEIMRTGGAFAEGGSVDVGMFGSGEDMTNMIAKSLEDNISPRMNDIFNDLQKQLMLEKDKDIEKKGDTQFKDEEGGEVSLEGSGDPIELGARVAKRLMKDFGLSDFQAAGAVGNFLNEGMSQGTGDMRQGGVRGVPTYNGPNTMGYGWAQWTNADGGGPNDRLNKAMIYLGMKDKPRAWTNEDNYKVLKWELQGPYKSVIDQMKNAKSVDEATMIWLTKFEGINDGTGPKRINSAKQVVPKIAQVKTTNLNAEEAFSGNIGGEESWRFGRTGSMSVQAGWSHAHFQDMDGNVNNLIKDAIPLVKRMAGKGLKPELFNATPILAGKDNDYYANIIRSGISQHTHHPGAKFDINMPGFPRVPFSLKNPSFDPGGGGNIAFVPGSGRTMLMHMSQKTTGYLKGGRVLKPTFATLAEDGRPEFVFDADTTRGLDSLTPNLLDHLNAAKTKPQLMGVLQSYAGYENMGMQDIIVELPEPELIPVPVPMNRGTSSFIGGSNSDPYESLALIG